jgi:HEAT repeat protein
MTPKNRWRMLLYAPLVAVVLFFLMHPYFRQRMFGPRIKGEPLWIWQQELRAQVAQAPPPTLWNKALSFVGLQGQAIGWMGAFPRKDPEMLPVLLSLADDPSEHVRRRVADALMDMPGDEQIIEVLLRMTNDRDAQVRQGAVQSLGHRGAKAAAALPRLRELLSDPSPDLRIASARSIGSIKGYDDEAMAMLKNELRNSTNRGHRMHASWCLVAVGKDSDHVFKAVVELCHSDPDFRNRCHCVNLLGHFGKKAISVLLPFLDDTSRDMRLNAVSAIQLIGADASEAVPRLLQLQQRETDAYLLHTIQDVLHGIDSKRFPAPPPWS